MRLEYLVLCGAILGAVGACSGGSKGGAQVGGSSGDGSGGDSGASGSGGNGAGMGSGGTINFGDAGAECSPTTCAELGWACGYTVDVCGNVTDCANEGLSCGVGQACVGGIDGPTECVAAVDMNCEVCPAIPTCGNGAEPTRLTGRVVTPGRADDNTANQVGVPNALVYILRSTDAAELPSISTGVPSDSQSCDRCDEQDLGPLLVGAVTDATGNFTLEGNVPVGVDALLVVKVGKFRRATTLSVPAEGACQTTALPTSLPDNPTRLPRNTADGVAVNIPHIAISTGRIDAMECVFEKMGIATSEFGNFGADTRIHVYRGEGPTGNREGARLDDSTPADEDLYGSFDRMRGYDLVVADCEGGGWDGRNELSPNFFPERIATGANVQEYVNRGGRLFASHLSFSWLHENGTTAYSDADPIATGLAAAATWDTAYQAGGNLSTTGTGVVSIVGTRPNVSPRIQSFADWLASDEVDVASPPDYEFAMTDPRSLAQTLGSSTEEFVYREDGNGRVQQFSFNTPYGAPEAAACGRVAYSGFHVATTGGSGNPFQNAIFPTHCQNALANNGNLTDQEKVLLYMLFDVGACVGDEPIPPPCVPITCTSSGARCGFTPDGCGNVLDCGACRPPK